MKKATIEILITLALIGGFLYWSLRASADDRVCMTTCEVVLDQTVCTTICF